MALVSGGSAGGGAGSEIGYDQITSSVNIVSTSEATPTTIISCAAHVFDGAAVLLTVYFDSIILGTTGNGTNFKLGLYESSTQITRLMEGDDVSAIQFFWTTMAGFRFTPTAGSHTYTIGASVASTTGTPQVIAGAGGATTPAPGYARFTKV